MPNERRILIGVPLSHPLDGNEKTLLVYLDVMRISFTVYGFSVAPAHPRTRCQQLAFLVTWCPGCGEETSVRAYLVAYTTAFPVSKHRSYRRTRGFAAAVSGG